MQCNFVAVNKWAQTQGKILLSPQNTLLLKIQITPPNIKDYKIPKRIMRRVSPLQIAKKSSSPVSRKAYEDVPDPNHPCAINDSSATELNHVISDSSEALVLTPTPKLTTKNNEQVEFSAINFASDTLNTLSVEAQIVANLLREARSDISNSVRADLRYKRLLDELVNIVIDEFSTLPEEKDSCLQLVSRKVALFCFMNWTVIAIFAVFFLGYAAHRTSAGPHPT